MWSFRSFKELGQRQDPAFSGWPQTVLLLAGLYNIAFGTWAVLFPSQYFSMSSLPPENLHLWQCIGMIVGLYGLGYLFASTDIVRYWPIVFIGLLGKLFGPIGFFSYVFLGKISISGFPIIVCNDLVWILPFVIILLRVLNHNWRLSVFKQNAQVNNGLCTETSQEQAQLTLYYDGACPMCSREIKFLQSITTPNAVVYEDISSEHFVPEKLGKSSSELMAEIHARTGTGDWLIGMDAFRAVYSHTPYGPLFRLTKLPMVRQCFDWCYSVFAKIRLRFNASLGFR